MGLWIKCIIVALLGITADGDYSVGVGSHHGVFGNVGHHNSHQGGYGHGGHQGGHHGGGHHGGGHHGGHGGGHHGGGYGGRNKHVEVIYQYVPVATDNTAVCTARGGTCSTSCATDFGNFLCTASTVCCLNVEVITEVKLVGSGYGGGHGGGHGGGGYGHGHQSSHGYGHETHGYGGHQSHGYGGHHGVVAHGYEPYSTSAITITHGHHGLGHHGLGHSINGIAYGFEPYTTGTTNTLHGHSLIGLGGYHGGLGHHGIGHGGLGHHGIGHTLSTSYSHHDSHDDAPLVSFSKYKKRKRRSIISPKRLLLN